MPPVPGGASFDDLISYIECSEWEIPSRFAATQTECLDSICNLDVDKVSRGFRTAFIYITKFSTSGFAALGAHCLQA
jgi:hypothetical protein